MQFQSWRCIITNCLKTASFCRCIINAWIQKSWMSLRKTFPAKKWSQGWLLVQTIYQNTMFLCVHFNKQPLCQTLSVDAMMFIIVVLYCAGKPECASVPIQVLTVMLPTCSCCTVPLAHLLSQLSRRHLGL